MHLADCNPDLKGKRRLLSHKDCISNVEDGDEGVEDIDKYYLDAIVI